MFRKSLLFGLCSVTLLAAAFTGLSRESQAAAGRRGYSNIATSPVPGPYSQAYSPYTPYTPGYDKHARLKYPWLFQNLPGHVGTNLPERTRVVERATQYRPAPYSRSRKGAKTATREGFDNLGSSAAESNLQSVNPATFATPTGVGALAAPLPPHAAFPFGSASAATSDGGGSMRGAGAPYNVNSPAEGIPAFRDEAAAQSTKLPPIPGNSNPNK